MVVSNAGNRAAAITNVSLTKLSGISNLVACDVFILAPAESCAISFNVTECGDNDLFSVDYTGGTDAQGTVYVSASWFNSRGRFALVEMSAGFYIMSNITITTTVTLDSSEIATLSTNSCRYTLNVTDSLKTV